MRVFSVTALVVLLGVTPAGFGVKPATLVLTAKQPVGQIVLSSLNARPVAFDTSVVKWETRAGSDYQEPVSDALVAPPIFTIQPYGTTLLRFAFRAPVVQAQTEASYRVILTEILASGGAPRQIVIPLFVPAQDPEMKSSFALSVQADLRANLTVTNGGNTHIYVGKLTLESNGETLYAGTPKIYVLADSSRAIALRLKALPSGSTVEVQIEGDEGESVSGEAVVKR